VSIFFKKLQLVLQDRFQRLVLRGADVAEHLHALVQDQQGQEHGHKQRTVRQPPEPLSALASRAWTSGGLKRRKQWSRRCDLRALSIYGGCSERMFR